MNAGNNNSRKAESEEKMKKITEEQKQRATERRQKLQEICKQVKAMGDGERARMASRMQVHSVTGGTLSPHNQCMISFQFPSASIVGGFRQWKKAGRCVRKGEHGIGIWCPRFNKLDNESEELEGFLFGTVFDVSQTEEIAEAQHASEPLEALAVA